MRFGVCTSIDNIDLVQSIGFDYLEASASTVAQMPEEDFEKAVERVKNAKIGVECFNILFPKTMPLLGEKADWAQTEQYLESIFKRIKALGGKTVVFGSGKCRSFGSDISFAEAQRQLVEVTKKTGEIAAKYSIDIVIEPLNCGEANTINTVAEGAMLAGDVNLNNVYLLADSYHMFKENEPMANITRVGSLKHTHVAVLNGRAYPTERDSMLEGFFEALAKIGYSGNMSIEGKANSFEADAKAAFQVLRKLAEDYNS